MIRHIVWWTMKEHANGKSAKENCSLILDASGALCDIKDMLSLEVSSNISDGTTVAAEFVLTSLHEDKRALENYKNNPIHKEFAKLITELASTRNCIDCEVDKSK